MKYDCFYEANRYIKVLFVEMFGLLINYARETEEERHCSCQTCHHLARLHLHLTLSRFQNYFQYFTNA